MTETQQNPIDQLKQADDIFRSVLQNVTPDQMGLPTVNDEWDVRALINHVVNGNMWAAENVRHGNAPRPSGDAVGDRNPMEAYTPSAEAMIAAFAEPGALGRTMTLPFGEMPAAGFAGFRFVDLLSHAWDMARTPTSRPSCARPRWPSPAAGWTAVTAPRPRSRTRSTSRKTPVPRIVWRGIWGSGCRVWRAGGTIGADLIAIAASGTLHGAPDF